MFDGEVDVLLSTAFSTCFKYLYLRLFLMGNLLSYSTRTYWLQYGGEVGMPENTAWFWGGGV